MSELTLVEFLTQRLDSDERDARKLLETDRRPVLSLATTVNHPARVLVEVQAKRAIVERAGGVEVGYPSHHLAQAVLRLLASVFSDHPAYRQEWTP